MGLAVSQIRLLALTSRKADVELRIQVDSKRKQMLTRQSTELSNQYYQRLQNSTIQYATSNGYEDVDYAYLMGYSVGGHITDDFFTQVITGTNKNIASKLENRMILTNQFGEVVVDNDLAKYIAKAKNEDANGSVLSKTANAIFNMIEAKSTGTQPQLAALYKELSGIGSKDIMLECLQLMIQNGGYQDGGTVYTDGNGNYYKSGDDASKKENAIKLQPGYFYQRREPGEGYANWTTSVSMFYKGPGANDFIQNLTQQYGMYLGNLISYFAPIMSAAILNGMSAKTEVISSSNPDNPAPNKGTGDVANLVEVNTEPEEGYDENLEAAKIFFNNNSNVDVLKLKCRDNSYVYYQRGDTPSSISKAEYESSTVVIVESNKGYDVAQNKENLQAGFKSGTYQLSMVSDSTRGTLKKNTLLNYFTNMHYVVDKTDSSKREEITAWFNAEQAIISEKETYWDTEIQNLSTELNSINTEIESVKKIKSNAIKSVFDWGGN